MPEWEFPIVRSAAREIHKQTIDQMVDQIMAMPERTRSSCWRLWSGDGRESM